MTNSAAAVPTAAPDDGIDPTTWRIAIAVIVGAFMSIIDLTIVNVGLRQIGDDLHAGSVTDSQWIITAYMLAVAAVIPLTGWMSTRIGGKRLYLVSIALFTLTSALCAASWNLGSLIAFRSLQGVAGGMIMPAGQIMLVRAAGPRHMGRIMGVIGVPMLLAPVVGPVVGGLLLQYASWQWLFLVNVPVGILGYLLATRLIPRDTTSAAERRAGAGAIDWLGFALAAVGLPLVVYGLAYVATEGDDLQKVTGPIVLGLLLVVAFVWRSLRAPAPLLDLRMWKNPGFAAAAVTSFVLGAGLFGALILLPLYYQGVRGQSVLHTGLLLTPQGLGAALGMFVSGRFTDGVGGGIVTIVGLLVTAATTLPFVFLDVHTSYVFLAVALFARGIGFGSSMMPAMAAAYAAIDRSQVASATPQLNVLQRVGGSVGTAVFATVLQRGIEHATSGVPASAVARAGGGGEGGAGADLSRAPAGVVQGVADAFGTSFAWVIAASVLTLVPAVVLTRVERSRRRSLRDGAIAAAAELQSPASLTEV